MNKWLLRPSQRRRSEYSLQNQFSFYRAQEISGNDMGLDSPPGIGFLSKLDNSSGADNTAYDHNQAPPPIYQPPQGASKVNPMQDYDMPPLGLLPHQSWPNTRQQNRVLESPPPTAQSNRSAWTGRLDPFMG